MRVSLRWLKKYLETDKSVEELIHAMTMAGLEVEEVLDLGMVSGKTVVGEILKINPVEGADKIRLVEVMADEKEPLQIVCGAWNIEEGDRVPVARFGMELQGPEGQKFELKPRKIKGIEGAGMLCSPRELGITDEHQGIWILPQDAPVAEPYDALVEIGITPNRPDALSMVGVARDLAAKTGGKVKLPDITFDESSDRIESFAKVSVEAREDCPRYAARVVRNVKIGPSPQWMQVALQSAGLRPINNIVDITNYVLLELGHPLHGFDLDKITGRHVIVRNPKPEEKKFVTLDDKPRKLQPDDLLICDASQPIALAGIMGGANTEVSESTVNVLIESAYFKPATIRRTRRRLDMSTDASYRFERGTDAKKLGVALNRAAQLMAEIAGGEILKGQIDVVGELPEEKVINLRLDQMRKLTGLDLSGREVIEYLSPLGFEVLRSDREMIQVSVPSHRVDVSLEVDVIEEVARIAGYEKIQEEPCLLPTVHKAEDPAAALLETMRGAAESAGLCEAINFSFVNEGANVLMGAGDRHQVRVLNPLSSDMTVMRRSLLPSLLENVVKNLNNFVDDVRLFEIGKSYQFEEAEEPEELDPKSLEHPIHETPCLSAVICGHRQSWRDGVREYDFYDVKGLAGTLLTATGLTKLVVDAAEPADWLHPGRSGRFLSKGRPVATFGEVHPALLKELDIKKRVYYLEIPLEGPILQVARDVPQYREVPRYPAVTRDIALLVDRSVKSLELERTILSTGGDMLSGVSLFDVYEGEQVESGKKSMAYSLTYRAPDRTLKEEEVAAQHEKVLNALKEKHGAVQR